MDDQFVKYGKLLSAVFLLFISFMGVLALITLAVRLLFGLFDYIPWASYIYMVFIVAAPGILFLTVFSIYTKRTFKHPAAGARYFSLAVFIPALLLWAAALVSDMITLFKKFHPDASRYNSYQFWMLVGSVLAIFITGLVQALATEKEKDWLEKRREREGK